MLCSSITPENRFRNAKELQEFFLAHWQVAPASAVTPAAPTPPPAAPAPEPPAPAKAPAIKVDAPLADKLRVMDLTAYELCEQGPVPIIVFNVEQDGNLARLLNGEKIGTVVHA